MVILGDYHTHTIYSSGKKNRKHATGTILENAIIAKNKGLKDLAITDHGFNHKMFGVLRCNIDKMRAEIEEAKKVTGINIYLGIEANFISKDGDIDLVQSDMDKLDFVVVGFHKMAKAKSFGQFFKFMLPNLLGIKTKRVQKMNTLCVLKAMDKYNIDVISHPGVGMKIDFNEVSKHAHKTNTMLEINGKRIAYKKDDVAVMVKNGAQFLIDSDAHSKEKVGWLNRPINFAINNNIPSENIANLGKVYIPKKFKGE